MFFWGGENFRTMATKKKKKSIANCLKGFLGGKKKKQNSTHFEGKKRLEVAYFTQRAPGQNWAGSQKVFYFPV